MQLINHHPPPLFAAIAIAGVVASFLAFHFLAPMPRIEAFLRRRHGADGASTRLTLIRRSLGVLLYGVAPLAAVALCWPGCLADYGLNLNAWRVSLAGVGLAAPAAAAISRWNASRARNLRAYPQIRVARWSASLLIASALSWIAYLLAYEYMMRGFLLFSCSHALGSMAAMLINVALYALIHLPKGIEETLGAIPLGIVLATLSLYTGSLLAATLIHITVALSSEWFSIAAHSKRQGQP